MNRFQRLFQVITQHLQHRRKGQSFVELALILPILLIMLMGLVEVVVYMGRYLDVLDLTREAARFASVRDPFALANLDEVSCSNPEPFNFYWHTACIFSPSSSSANCTNPDFCNGLNYFVNYNPAVDDIVISVYTISNNAVSDPVFPTPFGYWAYSNFDEDPSHSDNWKYDCQGNVIRNSPYFTKERVDDSLSTASSGNKGFVAVEYYFCYDQVLALPLVTDFIPNPLRVHVYTIMPLPAAQPSATPNS